jgi:hypothetical protein
MKRTLLTMLFTASVIINALFLYQRLEKKVYIDGFKKGNDTLYKKIIEQVNKKHTLTIEDMKGQKIVMVPQKQVKAAPAPQLPTHVVVEGTKQDANSPGK